MVRISFSDLPLRPRALSQDELKHVYGGCNDIGQPCEKDSDCCKAGLFACGDFVTAGGVRSRLCSSAGL